MESETVWIESVGIGETQEMEKGTIKGIGKRIIFDPNSTNAKQLKCDQWNV
jgi:hypothetical protein